VWSDHLDLVLVGFGEELGPLERVRHITTIEDGCSSFAGTC